MGVPKGCTSWECPVQSSVMVLSNRACIRKANVLKGSEIHGVSNTRSWEKYVVVGKGYAKTDIEASMKTRGELFEVISPGILPAPTP